MKNTHLLYSTNTRLSFRIANYYYDDYHYVWCSPHFDGSNTSSHEINLPSSSSPSEIGKRLVFEVNSSDNHSPKVKENREGLKNGASVKLAEGVIDKTQHGEILEIIEQSPLSEFRPLLFVIPFHLVETILLKAPVGSRASPFSEEYIIEKLPRKYFDIIPFSEGGLV